MTTQESTGNKWQDKAERLLGPTSASQDPTMMGIIDLFTAFLIFCIASSFSLLIHVPLLGALVRFRANYTPKGLQIGEEGGMTPHVGPVVPNYFAMLLRIKRIEVSVYSAIGSVRSLGEGKADTSSPFKGWSGLWKGYSVSTIRIE